MAIRYAVATGNWSNTATWNGGTLPTSSDDVYSNTFTVTIDTSPTVLSISNASTTGVTAGGSFVITNGITLTCTGVIGILGSEASFGGTVISNLNLSEFCYIVANIKGGNGGGGTGSSGVVHNVSGTITITGSATGGGNTNDAAVKNLANGVINITGNVSAVTSNSGCHGVLNNSVGIVNIFGTVTGAPLSGGASYGVYANSTGTTNITGSIQAGSGNAAVASGTNTCFIILTGPFLTTTNGINPNIATRWFWANSTPPATYYQIRTQNLATIRPLYTADSVGGNPAASNVRSGTVFGPASELTGTMVVPPAGSVNFGVPVDNTTGTALVTASSVINAIWNYPISGITTAGSIGERLKNTATVGTVNTILSNGLR